MAKPFLMVALALPLLTVAFGIAKSEYQSHQQEWYFAVRGYDPRDLLRGHYLRYEIDFGIATDDTCLSPSDCCLCLHRTGEKTPPRVTRSSCSSTSTCDGFIDTKHLDNLSRYYVSEDKGQDYEVLLGDAQRNGNAQIVVSIDRRGYPVAKRLTINGVAIEQTGNP